MNDQEKHRQAGLKALALAKKAEKIRKKKGLKPIYVGKGVNGEDLSGKKYVIKDGRKSNVNHSEVMKMLKEGFSQTETAQKFGITKQSVSYIQRKLKTA